MKLSLVRHATLVLSAGKNNILVDPCLAAKGTLPPYTLFSSKPRMNPTAGLPENSKTLLYAITHGLITHCRGGHFDHLDKKGATLLSKKQIPVYCMADDEPYLNKKRIKTVPLVMGEKKAFPCGTITPIRATHGHGLLKRLMGKGAGYLIELSGDPVGGNKEKTISIYIAGDTVLTSDVRFVLTEKKPDWVVINAGTATLDVGKPILMTLAEIEICLSLTEGRIIAVHMDAFNHCTTSREKLKKVRDKLNVEDLLLIPEDGETIDLI